MRKLFVWIMISLAAWCSRAFAFEATDGGIYFVNEDWFGHDYGSLNYLDADHTMHYRVYREANPLPGGGTEVLGITTQFGCLHEGKFYLVSKQANNGTDNEQGVGGRLVVADARTLEKVASFENIGGGDGRSFLGLTPDKGYIGASNGVFVFDIARMQVGGLVEGTGGGGLYSGQIGSMVQAGGKVFAAKQGVGVYVIDPQTDMLMDTLDFPTLYALTVATDGTVWGTLTPDDTGNGTSALLRIDPSTLATSEHPLPEGLELTGGWGAWRAGTFCAGVQSNVLYFMPGGRWASEGSRIVKYDIDADTFEEDFFTLPGQDLQYKQMFYGAGFRVDPRTNRLVCTATESGWLTHYQKNWVHFVDAETGELLETLRLDDYYWFPAMPVFPEAGGDAPTTGLMRPTLQVHAWPNPFIDYLVVRTEAAQRATLYDLAGKAVLTTKLQSGDNRIDTSTLPHGTYVLRCNGATAKVVK